MLNKHKIKGLGGYYPSVEAYYMDQLVDILHNTSDDKDKVNHKYAKLKAKYDKLQNKIKKAYTAGYKKGYEEGLEEGWESSAE